MNFRFVENSFYERGPRWSDLKVRCRFSLRLSVKCIKLAALVIICAAGCVTTHGMINTQPSECAGIGS